MNNNNNNNNKNLGRHCSNNLRFLNELLLFELRKHCKNYDH